MALEAAIVSTMQMRDDGSMTKFVPYLAEEAIERDAAALLAEYAQARGVVDRSRRSPSRTSSRSI